MKNIVGTLGLLIIGIIFGYGVSVLFQGEKQADIVMGHDMSNTMSDMTSGLQGKTGDAFDSAFLDEMIVHHQGAIDMARQVLTVSSRAELRGMAEEIISAQTKEIEQMKKWKSEWFTVAPVVY